MSVRALAPVLLMVVGACVVLDDVESGEPALLPDGWEAVDADDGRLAFSPGLTFTQEALVPGDPIGFTVTGAAPGDTVHFLFSTVGTGAGPCVAGLGGLCLDLVAPVKLMGTGIADGAGTAEIVVTIPLGAPQVFMFTQAVVDRGAGSVASATITAPILGGSLDVDGDGWCGGAICADPAMLPGDCADDDATVNPGVTVPMDVAYWDGTDWSFDYNCDGFEDADVLDLFACNPDGGLFGSCPHQDGWYSAAPGCGQTATWAEGCTEISFPFFPPICDPSFTTAITQPCL